MKKVIIWGAVLLVVGYFLLAVLPVMFMLVTGGGFDP
jgi:dipeptide/tripeptide permease